MNKSVQSLGAFGVVLASSLVAGLLVLQNDLQTCTAGSPNIIASTCVIHWQLIVAAFVAAIISAIVHYLSTVIGEHSDQIASLQTATGSVPAPVGTAVAAVPSAQVEVAIAPTTGTVPAVPVVEPPEFHSSKEIGP